MRKLNFKDSELDENHSTSKWMYWDLDQFAAYSKVCDFSTKTNCFWQYFGEPVKLT